MHAVTLKTRSDKRHTFEALTDDKDQYLAERIEARWQRARLESFKFCKWQVTSKYQFSNVAHLAEQLERLGRGDELAYWLTVGTSQFEGTFGQWIDCRAPLALAAGLAPEDALGKSFRELKTSAGLTDEAYKDWNFGRAEIWELV